MSTNCATVSATDAARSRSQAIRACLWKLLQPMSSEFFLDEPKGAEQRLELKLAPEVKLRDVIAAANEATDLIEVGRVMASMNDIFIKTVKQTENND